MTFLGKSINISINYKEEIMNSEKHIKVTGYSNISWKDAIVRTIVEASKTLNNLCNVTVLEQSAKISEDKLIEYRDKKGKFNSREEISKILTDKAYTENNYALTLNSDNCHIVEASREINDIISKRYLCIFCKFFIFISFFFIITNCT